jgi:hypothetical protein
MKTFRKAHLGSWFCVLMAFLLCCHGQAQTEFYEAEGRTCPTCHGSGNILCSHCNGEDLTQQTCQYCNGQDLTQQTCQYCNGEDLTHQTCQYCNGQDLTQQTCQYCSGDGFSGNARCVMCKGSGKKPRCVMCHGSGKKSRCVMCRGSGKKSRCIMCKGMATKGEMCAACAGFGSIEVFTAKRASFEDLRKSIESKTVGNSRAPPSASKSPLFEYSFPGEDGSHYGEISKETGRPKVVFVSGYTRRDGTYVQSHFRSLPNPQGSVFETTPKFAPLDAENGSYYGQPNQYGVPKTVHVNGYYRKDGTYVRGHYRSAPRR